MAEDRLVAHVTLPMSGGRFAEGVVMVSGTIIRDVVNPILHELIQQRNPL